MWKRNQSAIVQFIEIRLTDLMLMLNTKCNMQTPTEHVLCMSLSYIHELCNIFVHDHQFDKVYHTLDIVLLVLFPKL
jgi:type VI protein secretion system component Hcp